MKTKLILLTAFFATVVLVFTLTASAAIPHLMNFQGKATDKSGAPLNGSYNLIFRIYNSETGGTAKWSETQPNILISNGIFQVQLGSVTPLNLPFDEAYWISLEINTDGEMSPRTRLASVPYAYKAESLIKDPVIPFYRKGFDIECVDFVSIRISPGVMDVAGKMSTAITYSNTLQLAYPDNPTNRDWLHGSKMFNSMAYVYAWNNNDQLMFKFSDEAPNLSDQYGNTIQKPYVYKRYPDTPDGIYYRNIGKIHIDNLGNIATTDNLKNELPTGTVMAWAASTPPSGWLLCDGSAISRTDYSTLFAVIGTTYGAGDGSATFNIPDMKGSVPVGYKSGDAEFGALGKLGGEKTHKLIPAEVPSIHTSPRAYPGGANQNVPLTYYNDDAVAHNILQPYITLNYIIKT